jgi:stearoyl-CoA desaturase (delta-9 desaturase)
MGLFFAAFGLDGVLFGHVIPVAFVVIGSALNNLLGHKIGTQRYDTGDDSKNSVIVALFSWGEGWHNNHHKYPSRASIGEKWWEIDIAWYVILLIKDKRSHA